jgi:hypothetical protein
MAKPTPQYQKKILCEHMPSEALFMTYGLLTINENAQSAHLQSRCGHCKRQTSGSLLSSTVSHSGCLSRFPLKSVPELLQDVDVQARIHLWLIHYGAPPHFLLAVREFLNRVFQEQWIG